MGNYIESTESIERYVNGLRQTDIRAVWGTEVSVCGILLKEKSEDNIPFVGFESHTYPFMGDYVPFVVDYFPLWEIIFRLWEIIFR